MKPDWRECNEIIKQVRANLKFVWVFTSNYSRGHACGVFSTREKADEWIKAGRHSGILTEYPIDMGTLDFGLATHCIDPEAPRYKDRVHTPEYIGSFIAMTQAHYHYENGMSPPHLDGDDAGGVAPRPGSE